MWHIEKIEGLWFEGYELVLFELFAWVQPMYVIKWAKDTDSTLGTYKRSYNWNSHLVLCSCCLWPKFATLISFPPKKYNGP